MEQNNASTDAQTETKARYTVKALDHLKNVHGKYTEAGEIMIDSIDLSWDVKMVLAENGFHHNTDSQEFKVYTHDWA